MKTWLLGLNESYLAAWANKGLVRRGLKCLGDQDPSRWQWQDHQISGDIDGHQLLLTGEDVTHLSCSCVAPGPCFHQVAFLLGLKTWLESQGEESTPEAQPEPWEIDQQTFESHFGLAVRRKAYEWQVDGLSCEIDKHRDGVDALLYEKELRRMVVPLGSIKASRCSCKVDLCSHLASLMVQLNPALQLPEPTLEEVQCQAIQQCEDWLDGLMISGVAGLAESQMQQGQALVNELKQADLPRLSSMLAGLQAWLQMERHPQRMRPQGDYVRRLQQLSLLMAGLRQEKPPVARLKLMGRHRRNYYVAPKMSLLCLGVALWRSPQGMEGYRSYFYHQQQRRLVTLAEGRNASDFWSAKQGLSEAKLAQHGLMSLAGQHITLTNALLSPDGQLRGAPTTLLESEGQWGWSQLAPLLQTVEYWQQQLGRLQGQWWSDQGVTLACIGVSQLTPWTADPLNQHYQAQCVDHQGGDFCSG
ncbi:hypothetical protein CHH28_12255 [Bacterioplanes sanyensis]|uniref:SWIM-type domain-containing protein n=1 Tax=Bacterioplanes sanyensis TaxID=1249553 RepID=A0A222FK39_9GAMM|nr:hypothetical protein [Bacterioplanes sanyensis]ASP39397.1 hypothetical protein CHH28_12255 [Bacterioplanes sanyensis]